MRRSQARQSPASTPRKVVLVGDHTAGKTTLLIVFARAIFPDTPVVLVGCRKDLRGDPEIVAELARVGWHPVTDEEGLQMAQRIGASQYLECSAIQNDGVIDVFKAAALQSLPAPSARTTRRHCRLL
ncbi:GTP-binding protein RHO1 [Zopfochytrium polystomum]|nr:GTP-binding protein RHO1 [Zopfochytrium polystomum]KAI9345474.1 GTP-binding protein RHO1 [Zopfochytrium polystomum]